MSHNSTAPDFTEVQAWANLHLHELYERTGRQLRHGRGSCPLHDGDGQNFTIGRAGWFCHSHCATGGDGVDFIRRLQFSALPRRDGRLAALREIAGMMGVPPRTWTPATSRIPYQAPLASEEPAPRDELASLRADGMVPSLGPAIYAMLLELLPLGELGSAYMSGRGFDAVEAERYGFRSVEGPGEWRAVRKFLDDSFLHAELRNAGLLRFPWDGRVPCLVIPYLADGAVLGIRFRNITPSASGGDRYRDLAGTVVAAPFNAHALNHRGSLWLTEGEMNCLALHVHGCRAVGLPGAGRFNQSWAKMIEAAMMPGERLLCWYDSDVAGERGLSRVVDAITRNVEAFAVSSELDAAELHRQGKLAATIGDVEGAR